MVLSENGWTAEDMPALDGKKIIVTGANSGLGYEATEKFAEKGAHVIMACRSMERGREAKGEIEDKLNDCSLELSKLDLASLDSVKDFAEEYKANNEELHILCNNAGIMAIPRQETRDGFEKQFGVNHLGHFALTSHLIDYLIETSGQTRLVTQSSALHKKGSMNFEDLMKEQNYDKNQAYADSKLANLLFAFELDRKLQDADVNTLSIACHPGFSATNLQSTEENESSIFRNFRMKVLTKVLAQSAETGYLPMIYASVSEKAHGGDYIGPDGFMNMRGLPENQKPSEEARDEDVAEKLWKVSEELTGIDFELEEYSEWKEE